MLHGTDRPARGYTTTMRKKIQPTARTFSMRQAMVKGECGMAHRAKRTYAVTVSSAIVTMPVNVFWRSSAVVWPPSRMWSLTVSTERALR